MEYHFSPALRTFLGLAEKRMEAGHGCTLLLEGPPGGGKTAFAKTLGEYLGGDCHYYSGSPDKERDLLYEIDVQGVLKRESAWVEGPAWTAFRESGEGRYAVLLIDEVDKTSPGFDAFLLRLLEEYAFRSPSGETVSADPAKLAVVLTTNGRRKLRPEVLRRCQRIAVPLPENGRLERIIRQIAGCAIPDGLMSVVVRIGDAVRKEAAEDAPSPKEMALCCVDLIALCEGGTADADIVREVAASWLVKSGGTAALDKIVAFRWARALMREAAVSKPH